MSFLAPLFLLGSLVVALPIVFHLIRRSSREQMPFSSLMFLQPTPPRLTKRSRLEHIILLILRCLVICLLALAFARPFFQKPLLANPSGETGRKVIVLVDTSASMRREGLWAAALAKASEVLDKLAPGDKAAVLTFDNQVRRLVTFEQWAAMNPSERATVASGRLAELKPGWAGTQLGGALTAAAEAFAEADRQKQNLGPQRIILVTDLQEGSRLDGLQGYEWPRQTDVQIERVQPRRPTNAGLQWVTADEQAVKATGDAAVRIRISNSWNAQREQFQIHWQGVPAALPLDVYVPPGQSRILSAPKLPTNSPCEQLVLTGDDDEFDNSIFLLQPKAEDINVTFLGDETEKDSSQPLYYLKHAFQQTRRQNVNISTRATSVSTTPADLQKVRLLIATVRLTDSQTEAAKAFLNGGGTFLFIPKSVAATESIARLAGTDNIAAEEVTASNYAMFGLIDFTHPLFAPFADPRYNDFTKIHFWKYRRMDASRLHDARVLASFDGGDPALVEMPIGKGRLLVLTSGWQPADSQLALSSKFVPLLYSILDLAGGMRAQAAQFHIGETAELAGMVGPNGGQVVTVRKPDGTQVDLAAGQTRFDATDQPGVYSVTSVQPSARFVVNLDPAESRTAPLPIDQLEHLGVPLKPRELEWAKQTEEKRRLHFAELENQQKLWRWLTFAAVVVLLVETWLAGWLTRRSGVKAEVATT